MGKFMCGEITGIGYEGLDQASLLSSLRLRNARTVVDVRLNPISRKRGLSKVSLGQALAASGIDYQHERALGNPKDNRDGFALVGEAGASARERYLEYLNSADARAALARVEKLASAGTVVLLCFEKDQSACHRELVLELLRGRRD